MAYAPRYLNGTCANCDSRDVTVESPLFCSPRCLQAAQLVRYVRACRRDGRDQRPDVREAINMKRAMILGGGYPEERRHVPPEIRAEVFRSSGGQMGVVRTAVGHWTWRALTVTRTLSQRFSTSRGIRTTSPT